MIIITKTWGLCNIAGLSASIYLSKYFLKTVWCFQESQSDEEIEMCLTSIDDLFDNENDNVEIQEEQRILEAVNAQNVRIFILGNNKNNY